MGLAAFGVAAIGFILVKTNPAANLLTSLIATTILGFRVKFSLDPTDLIGLLSLWPAWVLWKSEKSYPPKRLAYVALSIGVLASIATSPREWTIHSVTDLAFKDGILYAADKVNYGPESFPVAVSKDGGLTWEKSTVESDMSFIDEKVFPIEDCKFLEYYGVTDCYRVTSDNKFLYGYKYPQDKKYSWDTVFPSKSIVVKAFDMVIIPYEGHQVILVAVGEAGILRKALPDGHWELIEVLRTGGEDIFKHWSY